MILLYFVLVLPKFSVRSTSGTNENKLTRFTFVFNSNTNRNVKTILPAATHVSEMNGIAQQGNQLKCLEMLMIVVSGYANKFNGQMMLFFVSLFVFIQPKSFNYQLIPRFCTTIVS